MTNTEMLKQAIQDSGMKIIAIADKTGINRGRLYKILGGADCTASEIVKIGEVLRLTQKQRDDIFLRKNVTDSNT